MVDKMARTQRLTNLSPELKKAYQRCHHIAKSHYENFPIASFFLPKYLQRSITAVYAFARTADDIADEGNATQDQRLEQMTKFESNLYDIQYGKPPTDPIFIALEHTIESFNLPIQLFYDLLTAFRQDILKNRYHNFEQIKDYCHYSANPIGRILLHLTGQSSKTNLQLSDHICTGLQLINFIQDISIDLDEKDRCYIPLDDLQKYDVQLDQIYYKVASSEYQLLINRQIERASEIFYRGISLGARLPGFFGLEIRFIIACGLHLLEKLRTRTNVYQRPIMKKRDLVRIFAKVCISKNSLGQINEPVWEKV